MKIILSREKRNLENTKNLNCKQKNSNETNSCKRKIYSKLTLYMTKTNRKLTNFRYFLEYFLSNKVNTSMLWS